jgi:His/Glu/Gln/Arg/opine family amino acid ABC transporter permease subunit
MQGYDWNFAVLQPYWHAFFFGTGLTLALSGLSFLLGTLAGTVVGAFAARGVVGKVLWGLNDALRALPPLVLIFLFYFFPVREVFGVAAPSPFWTAVAAFAVSQAAYSAELTRAALQQVPRSAVLSGLSIGLNRHDLWRFVILPDLVRQMMPAQIAFFIGIVRLSNLASVIGVQEVVYVSRQISSQAFRSFEPWLVVAAIYVVIVVPLTIMLRSIEKSAWLMRRT